jgi:hypothetical protein
MTGTRRPGQAARSALVAVPLVALLAACSGGSAPPSVAHLGASSATTTAPSSGGPPPAANALAKMEAYAQCMRMHGIRDFPDPTAGPNGGAGFKIQAGAGSDLDPNSTANQAADKACSKVLPNKGVPKALTAAQQQAFLNWAACIRAHGLPNFADPDFSGGGIAINLSGGAGLPNGRGPSAPFKAAQQACKSKLPGGFGGLGG